MRILAISVACAATMFAAQPVLAAPVSRIVAVVNGDMITSRELDKALKPEYLGQQIEDHRPLNTGYTMPVAETASNFNELIIVNDAIAKLNTVING